jgi:hypothetical protein
MMADTIMLKGTRCVVLVCANCGVPFTMPEIVYDQQVEEGGFHTCPNGHSRGWDKSRSERERQRREQERLKQSVAQKDDEIAELKTKIEKATRAATKSKKRAAAGVCPCCHRTVKQMAAHMKTKHPDYTKQQLKLVAS